MLEWNEYERVFVLNDIARICCHVEVHLRAPAASKTARTASFADFYDIKF
jgi:hypothetical protein